MIEFGSATHRLLARIDPQNKVSMAPLSMLHHTHISWLRKLRAIRPREVDIWVTLCKLVCLLICLVAFGQGVQNSLHRLLYCLVSLLSLPVTVPSF
jgi:hypothetical protein